MQFSGLRSVPFPKAYHLLIYESPFPIAMGCFSREARDRGGTGRGWGRLGRAKARPYIPCVLAEDLTGRPDGVRHPEQTAFGVTVLELLCQFCQLHDDFGNDAPVGYN